MKKFWLFDFIVILLFGLLFFPEIYAGIDNFTYYLFSTLILLIICKRCIYIYDLKKQILIIKTPKKTLIQKWVFYLELLVGIIMIANFWLDLLGGESLRLSFLVLGIIIFSIVIFEYKDKIVFSNEWIAYSKKMRYSSWEKISEYEIKGKDELMIRTPSIKYFIKFVDIPENMRSLLINLLNEKLGKVFKGTLIYEKCELEVFKNKA